MMRKIAVQKNRFVNDVDCDRIDDTIMFLHPINRKVNSVFGNSIKNRILHKLKYFPDFFVTLYIQTKPDTKEVSKIELSYIFWEELCGRDVKFNDNGIIQNEIDSFLTENGYDVNDPVGFVEKLYEVVPYLKEYIMVCSLDNEDSLR